MNFQELDPSLFASNLKSESNSILIDVREEYEFEDDNIGGVNIPMGEILNRTEEFNSYDSIFLCCKSGKRSKTVAYHLCSNLPNKKIISLTGGIEATKTNHV